MINKGKKYKIFESIGFAFRGILKAFEKERNVKIHIGATVLVCILGIAYKISVFEWLVLVLTIMVVIAAEIINSSIEACANLVRDRLNLSYWETYWIRNFASGGVMVLALGALIIGAIIFFPKIF